MGGGVGFIVGGGCRMHGGNYRTRKCYATTFFVQFSRSSFLRVHKCTLGYNEFDLF